MLFKKHRELFRTNIKPELKILFKGFDRREMSNSYILSYYRYYGKVHVYMKVHERLGNDLKKTRVFFNKTANTKEDSDKLIEDLISSSGTNGSWSDA